MPFAEVDKDSPGAQACRCPSAQAGHGDADASAGRGAYRTRPLIGEATICVAERSSSQA